MSLLKRRKYMSCQNSVSLEVTKVFLPCLSVLTIQMRQH